MNLLNIDNQIRNFQEKIIKTLKLKQIKQGNIPNQRKLCNWVLQQSQKQNKVKNDSKSILGNKFLTGMVQKIMKIQQTGKELQNDLRKLLDCVKRKFIPNQFSFECKTIPPEIVSIVNELKGKQWEKYYGEVRGPLLNNVYIMKKQDFHSNIELVKVNGLKLIMIEEKVAHKYQRNLIQQIFGRIFRSKGSLSTVIKIELNNDPLRSSHIFCYIQDRQIIDQDNLPRSLGQLQSNKNKLELKLGDNLIQIDEINVLQIFLAQILVLPVQSLVSDYILKPIRKQNQTQGIQMIKCNQQDQQEIVKQTSLRQHSSLRNPLLYFFHYIQQHSIQIKQVQKISTKRQLYACFYRCLQIIIKFILVDFQTAFDQFKINSSICFNIQVFRALWTIFHKISMLSSWMTQVIQPVKRTITIGQIISHYCPIFNQISASYMMAQNYSTYKEFYNNVQMQSFLGSKVNKKSLEKYKDIYINQSQLLMTKAYSNQVQVYNEIFGPVIQQANLEYLDPIQSCYILYFCCKYKFQYHPPSTEIPPKWKQKSLWKKCIKCLQQNAQSKNEQLPFIDIGFDIIGFASGINIYQLNKNCFERVKNFQQIDQYLIGIDWFVDFTRLKFQSNSQNILSSLLQKALKYKKFRTCRSLLAKKVRIKNFEEIINFNNILNEQSQHSRQILLKTIQQDSPQMHRLYKWQQLMLVNLKKPIDQSIKVQTVDFGFLYIPKIVFQQNIKNGRVINNLSRKDYKFTANRQIAQVSFKSWNEKTIKFYIEASQFPIIPYFYRIFLNHLETPEIIPYFTSFFYQNRFYHLIQSVEDSLNYGKGLTNFTQSELNALTDQTLKSQAIIISMILSPSKIDSKDIIICPTKAKNDQIFMVDLSSNYCKDFIHKYLGKVTLNTKNSLFLMQQMHKTIHKKLIAKYSQISIQKICQQVFQQCKKLNYKISQLKIKYYKEQQVDETKQFQLLALMFEEGFLFSVMQRMFKIKRLFIKNPSNFQSNLSFFKILQTLSPQTSYYYQQVFNSNSNLLDREKVLFNDNYKRPFLQISLVQFFGSFQRLQQKDYVFPLHYDKFSFEGPSQNLTNIGTNVKKFLAYKSNEIPQNLTQFPNDIFEYFMKNCDISNLQISKKEKILQIIKLKSKQHLQSKDKRILPLSYIGIKSFQFIKQKNFANNFSFERVEQLLIQSCKLGDYQLNNFPKTIENILYLNLRNISGLKYIGENVLYGKPIEIKHLKSLSIIECNDLISIDIKCDILQNLQLRNNKSFQTFYLYSLNLKNISIYNMQSLIFQNLGIYIAKGVNVLSCKTSCHGDLMKLFAQDYQTYIANIMRFLLIKFYEDSDSRYYIMLTLLKMREVDQSLFAMAGLTNFKAVSSMFSKFGQDIEDKVLTEILRIYIQNPYRKRVCINDLTNKAQTSVNTQRVIRIINESLNKALPSNLKSINQFKFYDTKSFFNKMNTSNLKIMVDRLKLDKNMTLVFENIKQEMEGKSEAEGQILSMEIDTIRYISMEKYQIEKINIFFRNCSLKYSFLENIFKGTKSISQVIKFEEQSILDTAFKRKQVSRISLKQQNKKYIKITGMSLQGCFLMNDKYNSLVNIQGQLKQAQSQLQDKSIYSIVSQVNSENQKVMYSSIKNLKIENSSLQDFQFLFNFNNLASLSLCKCSLNIDKLLKPIQKQPRKQLIKSQIQLYKRLFQYLSTHQIHTLQLQGFFTLTNSTQQWLQFYYQFYSSLKRMKKLAKLKLNNNYFSNKNFQMLQKAINQSQINELQLNKIMFQFDSTSKILDDKIENQKMKCFQNIFSSSTKLKSLAIQLNNKELLQKFVISIAKNQHLIDLQLTTNYQISSNLLAPLNDNHKLQFISSNVQLPLWVLNHVKQNRSIRKSFIKHSYIQNDADEDENNNPLNVSMSYTSLTNIRVDSDYFKLGLSLDGGGVRGMLLATQLNQLTTKVGYPLHKIFDCIGGTSIGGILALASTGTLDGQNPVANTQQLMLLFSRYGKDIFKKTQIMQLKNLFDTKYSAQSFEGLLKNYFKDCRISNCLSETNVIVTAVNRVDNKDYIFRSMQSLLNRDKDFYMRDVARATSAAPTYFPSAEIKNVNASLKLSLVDGGVGLNNPSKLVIDQIKKIASNSGIPQNYFLLSLGTGKLPSEVIPQYAGLKDLAPIIDSFTESAAYFVERDLASNYKGHFLRVSPLINVKSKKDAQLDNTSESIIEMYRQTGLQAARKYFENTLIFGKYRNLSLVEWLRQNTARKYQY